MATIVVNAASSTRSFPAVTAGASVRQAGGRIDVTAGADTYQCSVPVAFANGTVVPSPNLEAFTPAGRGGKVRYRPQSIT